MVFFDSSTMLIDGHGGLMCANVDLMKRGTTPSTPEQLTAGYKLKLTVLQNIFRFRA